VFAGWDIQKKSLSEAIKDYGILDFCGNVDIDIFSPIIGPLDYIHRVEQIPVTHPSLSAAIEKAKQDISEFKSKNSLDKVIVVNFSSPMYCGKENLEGWNSTTAYSQAAVSLGADWVEFTPSNSITNELESLAIKSKARIAGRDGSTGQTILKLLFKDFMSNRGFFIDGWYSTNIIGNNDGKVLAHKDYNVEKLLDKKSVLNDSVKDSDNHVVEISYYKPAGDNKESWDCIDFSGWLDSKMSLRLNWHGRDSLLASVLALDIITCLIKCERMNYPYGIVKDLAICFKNPVNKNSNSYFDQFKDFHNFVLGS
jgi:myo-inositol-1-phosphate synthase